jgi:hypothetical protein
LHGTPLRLPRVTGRYPVVVLQVAVNVKKLGEPGKKYPWPEPTRCFSCNSPRVWGHGYVQRYFEGYTQPLWVKRLRCPDCRIVYTLRPDLFYQRFRYSLWTILSSLVTRIVHHRFMPCLPRQNQQYWYTGLLLQAQRLRTVPCPDMRTVNEIIFPRCHPREPRTRLCSTAALRYTPPRSCGDFVVALCYVS